MREHREAHPYGRSTDRARRTDVRRARTRRLRVTQLIVFSLLAVAIVGVGWYAWGRLQAPAAEEHVIQQKQGAASSEDGIACPEPDAVPTDPKAVQVRVLNGTRTAGLAGSLTDDLAARGYDTGKAGNTRESKGPVTIVYGPGGYLQARSVATQFQKPTLRMDQRTGADVDVLVGAGDVSLVKKKTAQERQQKPVSVPKGCEAG